MNFHWKIGVNTDERIDWRCRSIACKRGSRCKSCILRRCNHCVTAFERYLNGCVVLSSQLRAISEMNAASLLTAKTLLWSKELQNSFASFVYRRIMLMQYTLDMDFCRNVATSLKLLSMLEFVLWVRDPSLFTEWVTKSWLEKLPLLLVCAIQAWTNVSWYQPHIAWLNILLFCTVLVYPVLVSIQT